MSLEVMERLSDIQDEYFFRLPYAYIIADYVWPGVIMSARRIKDIQDMQFDENDVVIASYPKSGTTWMAELVSAINYFGNTSELRKLRQDARVPWLELDTQYWWIQFFYDHEVYECNSLKILPYRRVRFSTDYSDDCKLVYVHENELVKAVNRDKDPVVFEYYRPNKDIIIVHGSLFVVGVEPGWIKKLAKHAILNHNHTGIRYSTVTKSEKELVEIAVFLAASDGFSKKNTNCDVKEATRRSQEVTEEAIKDVLRVRGYVSTVIGCPYDGKTDPKIVAELAEKLLSYGCYEVSLGDTIGIGSAGTVNAMLNEQALSNVFVVIGKCKLIYVARNPKDNAVSFFHFHRMARFLGCQKTTWDEFFALYMAGSIYCGSWFEHVLGYWNLMKSSPHKDKMMFCKFEEMKDDLPREISKIADFMDVDLNADQKQRVLEHCTFDSMKKNKMANRDTVWLFDQKISKFMRKGQVGDWRNYFTFAQSEAFDDIYKKKMSESGLEFRFD